MAETIEFAPAFVKELRAAGWNARVRELEGKNPCWVWATKDVGPDQSVMVQTQVWDGAGPLGMYNGHLSRFWMTLYSKEGSEELVAYERGWETLPDREKEMGDGVTADELLDEITQAEVRADEAIEGAGDRQVDVNWQPREARMRAAVKRGVRKALAHEGGDLKSLSDEELCKMYYEELGNSLPEATTDIEVEMDSRGLEADVNLSLSVNDAEGDEIFYYET